MSNAKTGDVTSPESAIDPEILNNLDMLVDYQVIGNEQEWDTVEKLEELTAEEKKATE